MKHKQNRLNRILFPLIISGLLLFSLPGCTGGSPADTESVTTDGSIAPESSAGPDTPSGSGFLGSAPLEEYSVIFNPESVYSVRGAQLIASAVYENYDIKLDIKPDTAPVGPHEILIGDTDRPESKAVSFNGEGEGYTAADENGKLVLKTSSPAYLLRACEQFAEGISNQSMEDFDRLPTGYRCDMSVDERQLIGSKPTADTACAEGSDLRIMSFNILHENYNDKLPISGRDTAVSNAIAAYHPDVVGLEEVSEAWHDALNSIFCGSYAFIPDDIAGTGRSYSTLFYNTRTAELLEYGTKVYDAATNNYLRNLTWGRFRRLSDGQEFIVTATHWDISSHEADRVLQAKENAALLNSLAEKYGLPIFSCGDYNRGETTAEFTGFISATGMADAKLASIAAGNNETVGATSHTIGAMPNTGSGTVGIDHIVFSKSAKILYYSSVTDIPTLKASDHCPIIADFSIGNTKTSETLAATPGSTALTFSVDSLPTSVSRVPDGKGTATSPYVISSKEELIFFRDSVCAGNSFTGKYIILDADISVSGSEWIPIGSTGYPFCGSFNGNGHTVSGITITEANPMTGFFGFATSYTGHICSVSNLKLEGSIDVEISSGNSLIGGLAGSLGSSVASAGKTKISSVISNINITVRGGKNEPRAGGFCGNIYSATVENCTFTGSVDVSITGSARLGGFAGQSYATDFIGCINDGTVTGASSEGSVYGGGISGITSYTDYASSSAMLCVNNGNVKTTSANATAFAGGITGQAYSAGTDVGVTLGSCLNTGTVSATVKSGSKLAYGGGIIGYCNKKSMTVDSCVNTSSKINGNSPSGSRAGGIIGVFNLASDNETLLVKNCTTVGALYGYLKANAIDNKEKVSSAEAEARADEIRQKIK